MNRWLLFLLCLSCQTSAEIAEQRIVSPVPATKIFSNQQFRSPNLSPDAKYVTVFEYTDEKSRIGLIERLTQRFYPLVDLGEGGRLEQYFWLSSKRLFIEVVANSNGNRIPVTAIIEINDEGDGIPQFTSHRIRHKGYVLGRSYHEPAKLVYALQPKKGDTEIYVTDPMALTELSWRGSDEIHNLIDDAVFYFYDSRSDRLIGLTYDEEAETFTLRHRALRDEKWQILLEKFDTDYTFKPVGFFDENTLAVLSDISTDKIALYRYNINTQTFSDVLYEHESYDLVSATVNYESGEPASVTYYKGGELTVEYLNSAHNYRQSVLNANLDGRNAVLVDYSPEADVYVVAAYAPDAPADLYVYDVQKKVARLLFSVQPELDGYTFSAAQLVTVQSDNKQVESYYYPSVGEANDVLLVMPHGGPVGVRDTAEFNRVVQFYTTRGYAVLQVNFHGSFGFGKAFRQGGVGEFGQQIERDIVKAIDVVQQQYPTSKRCAIGASYGGYSALMLSILHPDLIDCVVARFGVYDLPLMFNESNLKTSEEWLEKVENTVGEYSEDLFTISPLYLANKITRPLLLTAGYNDKVAAFEHTQRLDYVLTKLGKSFEHVYYKRTGHGHSNWGGDQHEHVVIDDFIRRKLNIADIDILSLADKEQQLITEDLLQVADDFSGSYRLDKDEEKAAYFYQKAMKSEQPEALLKAAKSQLTAIDSVYPVDDAIELLTQAAEKNNAEAAYELAYRYLLDYRFDAPNPERAKLFLDKALELEEGHRSVLLKFLWDCIWAENGSDYCLTAIRALPEDEDKQYRRLKRRFIAELISRFEGTKTDLETILNEYEDIAPSSADITLLNRGLLTEMANGEKDFVAISDRKLIPGDTVAVRFKVGGTNIFRAADQDLGIVSEWQGVKANGEIVLLGRMFLYGQPREYRYGQKTPWQSGRILTASDLQFKALRLVLKDIYNQPILTEKFDLTH